MATQTSDVLRLQTNVPETIALRFTDGLTVSSKFGGDQMMFSLVDGRKMFLPPVVSQKIKNSGIRESEPFTICKREVANGNRRTIEYQIDLVEIVEHHDNGRIHAVATPVAAAPPVAAPVAPAALPPAAVATSTLSPMTAAGIAAIDAVLEVERYARDKGMTDFEFGSENIQKVWMTLYIDSRKGGRA
jgi:hypothetical protein